MREGRIPAQCSASLTTANTTLSSPLNTDANSMHENVHCQQVAYTFGNRCGHFPTSPRTANIPKHHKKRFPFLEQAKLNLYESYLHPLRHTIGKIFYHNDKINPKGGYRKKRSELRETVCCTVGYAILHSLNIKKMMVGKILESGIFHAYGIQYIADLAGVSLHQARKAINVFIEHGYVTLTKRLYVDDRDGKTKSASAVISVSPDLLLDLDIDPEAIREKQTQQETTERKASNQFKSAEYNKQQRKNKKAHKKAMLDIRKTLAKAKQGKPLNAEEKALLDREMPGYNRYKDYTGCYQENAPRGLMTVLSDYLNKPKPS